MDQYQNRRWVIVLIMLFISFIFLIRLFYIQVIDDKWKNRALNISLSNKTIQPARGLIYDRNGALLVEANQVYDVWVTPNKINTDDTAAICELFGFSGQEWNEKITTASEGYNRPYKPSLFVSGISKNDYAAIGPRLRKYAGFEVRRSTNRSYPNPIAAHVLGYIRKIPKEMYEDDKTKDEPYYLMNDYVGITGLEKVYEKELRGVRGFKAYLKDNVGNEKKDLEEFYAEAGKNLFTTLDLELQAYGELLMGNKLGCIVAIEPSTGEILAMVSAPSYDPNGFVGRDFGKNHVKLEKDNLKPLIFRPIYNDKYRPGSIFKLVQSLVALEEGLITPQTGFPCNKIIGCHNHEHPANVAVAIQHSCNPYFYQVYKRLIQRGKYASPFKDARYGIEKWREIVNSFGLGVKLNTDLPSVKPGNIPDTSFYDKWYGKNRWAFSTIYSNSIGEGEIEVSPLQMANLAAIIANRGYYYTPHLVRSIGENGSKRPEFLVRNFVKVDPKHFEPVIQGMELVVASGTGRAAQVDSVKVCGKTGTVQNKTFNDHSVFIAFAPKDNPKIAIAAYVEYGTWGGTWAAPIASLMIEKYLNDSLSDKAKIKEQKVLNAYILDPHSNFMKPE